MKTNFKSSSVVFMSRSLNPTVTSLDSNSLECIHSKLLFSRYFTSTNYQDVFFLYFFDNQSLGEFSNRMIGYSIGCSSSRKILIVRNSHKFYQRCSRVKRKENNFEGKKTSVMNGIRKVLHQICIQFQRFSPAKEYIQMK